MDTDDRIPTPPTLLQRPTGWLAVSCVSLMDNSAVPDWWERAIAEAVADSGLNAKVSGHGRWVQIAVPVPKEVDVGALQTISEQVRSIIKKAGLDPHASQWVLGRNSLQPVYDELPSSRRRASAPG